MVKGGPLVKMTAFNIPHALGTFHTTVRHQEHIPSFCFILIYSVQFKVKVKTSNHALGIVLTSFETKTVNDHLHTFLNSTFTFCYTRYY